MPAALIAQQASGQEANSTIFSNGVFLVMLTTIVLLLFVIKGMAEVVKAGAAHRARAEKEKSKNAQKIAAVLFFVLAGKMLYAQNAGPAPEFTYWRMGAPLFFLMLTIIVF
ncbi:MAG TPA: hypothetical protein VFU15_16145, partial [Bacteroidia bacterium]|nr:hypothetical protein [Bacteroidia bacterium]